MSGIYSITNLINGKRYIGQSTNIRERWYNHKRFLNNGTHANPYLQHAWNKYSEECFIFEVIEECDEKDLDIRESYWIDYFDSMYDSNGYNLMYGDSNGIHHHSEETLEKLRQSTSMLWMNEKWRTRQSIAHQHPRTEAQIEASKRYWAIEENHIKSSIAHKGESHPQSIETREKISQALTGIIRGPLTEERKKHLSIMSKQMWKREGHKEKMSVLISEAKKGTPLSQEHKDALLNSHTKQQRAVVQFDEHGNRVATYVSAAEAYRCTGANAAHIAQCCLGNQLTCGGFYWRYLEDVNEENSIEIKPREKGPSEEGRKKISAARSRPVAQIDNDGNIINSFKSVTEARQQTGIKAISAVCRGEQKTAGGYRWQYLDK